jgi:hypothetical protein
VSEYRVIGTLAYRGHEPGETFIATLDLDAELRAIERGNIIVIDSSPTRLRPGSWKLPDGWRTAITEMAPEGAFSLEGAS